VTASKHRSRDRISRQEAAERLTDIAYALTTDGRLSLGIGRQVTLPVADEVVLTRESRTSRGRVELELELSWSTGEAGD
jgi:amphi-Trp domain-containing protein